MGELPRVPPGKWLPGGAVRKRATAELRRRYEAGETIRQLAKASGYSYGRVHGLLRSAGTVLRERGGWAGRRAGGAR